MPRLWKSLEAIPGQDNDSMLSAFWSLPPSYAEFPESLRNLSLETKLPRAIKSRMSVDTASAEHDKITMIAVSALACILQDIRHEGLGHGVTAWLSGAHRITMSTVALQSDIETRWIAANGTPGEFGCGSGLVAAPDAGVTLWAGDSLLFGLIDGRESFHRDRLLLLFWGC